MMRSALFWDITQCKVVIPSKVSGLVLKELLLYAAQYLHKSMDLIYITAKA
jgi:hypothetical protein